MLTLLLMLVPVLRGALMLQPVLKPAPVTGSDVSIRGPACCQRIIQPFMQCTPVLAWGVAEM